jgi:hypothetical protein
VPAAARAGRRLFRGHVLHEVHRPLGRGPFVNRSGYGRGRRLMGGVSRRHSFSTLPRPATLRDCFWIAETCARLSRAAEVCCDFPLMRSVIRREGGGLRDPSRSRDLPRR